MPNRASFAVTILLGTLSSACILDHHGSDFARRMDDALDESEVGLADALAVADHALRNTRLVAGELDPYRMVYEADLWDGDSLVHAWVDLGGDLLEIDDYGWDDRADLAAGIVAGADVSPYEAIDIAEDLIDDGRAFELAVVDPWYEVEVLADFDIFVVWISPQTGEIVDVVVEHDHGHHQHCPHVCW